MSTLVTVGGPKSLDIFGTILDYYMSIGSAEAKGVHANTADAFRPSSRTRNYLSLAIFQPVGQIFETERSQELTLRFQSSKGMRDVGSWKFALGGITPFSKAKTAFNTPASPAPPSR